MREGYEKTPYENKPHIIESIQSEIDRSLDVIKDGKLSEDWADCFIYSLYQEK